ncbi:hypothetical protein CIG75_14425 [Tumebacillus algifaecis]|uniref:Uncharacterized protein n=1 Tax=Tumebacillus algifaecis TaxID=1214604 RepID=A0A223D3M3_9BACL|nr:hypothetical protein [Tumebacillus algifaecis]ASS76037.1 hypothetical protein CIG75_14425 [Tumebacillus algifaecis]
MPIQINMSMVKVNHVMNSFVNIGPSVKTIVRSKASFNQGYGQSIGEDNQIETKTQVDDRDGVDMPYQKIVVLPR